jgi:hypothetical protein
VAGAVYGGRPFPLGCVVILVVTFLVASIGNLVGQTPGVNREKYRIHIKQTDQAITIDGLLQEEVWSVAEKAENFQLVTPIDTGMPRRYSETAPCQA